MAIHVALSHRTHYQYDRQVALSPHVVRLRPAPHCRTPILSYSLSADAADALRQLAAGSARQLPGAPRLSGQDARRSPSRSTWWPRCRSSTRSTSSSSRRPSAFRSSTSRGSPKELAPFLEVEPAGPAAARVPADGRSPRTAARIDFLVDLNQRLSREISYVIRLEPGVQTPEETLALRQRLVPRHGMAAGAGAPAPRARGALRLRLSDSARRPT